MSAFYVGYFIGYVNNKMECKKIKKTIIGKSRFLFIIGTSILLAACANQTGEKVSNKTTNKIFAIHQTSISDPIMTIAHLSEHQREWKNTRYRLGGNSKRGVDCSAFTQITYRDLFGIKLPRTTVEQAKAGNKVDRKDIRTGDLVFFNTGRGPNGKHVGVYVKNGQFLHASTKGGVIYSDINSPYWSKAFWQARRL
ncbi:putative lipoprotein NlpC [Nicoletella semolina]|uniref:Putative lipoprotein NlpC n=2 Tax=Nicoletella semolina TaxID=271160 RepID=A0A4R2NAP2_9PAST|nr:putative lipoprotein NlpC [Nicoletella semolina]